MLLQNVSFAVVFENVLLLNYRIVNHFELLFNKVEVCSRLPNYLSFYVTCSSLHTVC